MQTVKVLVVEDFEPFRQFVCSTLRRKAEFQVSEASEGLEAVRKAEQLQPDLILMDVGLPGLSGIEVAQCTSKLSPAAKILFVSQESPDVLWEAVGNGAQGYVRKLHAHRDLLRAIDAVLKGKRFVGSGLVAVRPHKEHRSEHATYLWQQAVMEAFESPSNLLPRKISIAERTIATRLKDPNQKDIAELLALRCALRSLSILIDETKPQPENQEEKEIA